MYVNSYPVVVIINTITTNKKQNKTKQHPTFQLKN